MFNRRRPLWYYGIVGLFTLAIVGSVVIFLTFTRTSAEAAVREACAQTAAVDSYDLVSATSGETSSEELGAFTMTMRLEISVSGSAQHAILRIGGVPNEPEGVIEQIYDGQSARYLRRSDSSEWTVLPATDEGMALPFPHSRESLCPDVDNATLLGEETLDGVQTRKYKVDTLGDSWHIWIDSEGWLVQTEELPSGVAGASEDLPLFVTTYSGIGESNTIVIPTVGQ